MTAAIAQVNVRMNRELKERGDATLSLVGSSPVKIIRQLWERLAAGGDAYERIIEVLCPVQDVAPAADPHQCVMRSTSLFWDFGTSLGKDLPEFEPDPRPTSEILEDAEWELLKERGLA